MTIDKIKCELKWAIMALANNEIEAVQRSLTETLKQIEEDAPCESKK